MTRITLSDEVKGIALLDTQGQTLPYGDLSTEFHMFIIKVTTINKNQFLYLGRVC